MEQSVPKRQHIKFRRRGITKKKEHKIQNTAKVSNQKWFIILSNLCLYTCFAMLNVVHVEKYYVADTSVIIKYPYWLNFMVAQCISNIKHFIVQLMHTNYKILRLLK